MKQQHPQIGQTPLKSQAQVITKKINKIIITITTAATIRTTTFEIKYVENAIIVSLNPTSGFVRYLERIARIVKVIGVKIPIKTGIQVGHFWIKSLTFSYFW